MSSPLQRFLRLLRKFWWAAAAILVVILAVVALAIYSSTVNAEPAQPIAFNHEIMVSLGIDCQFCHADARRSESAGMPSVEKCMGCHKVVDPTNPVIKQVAA